MFHLASWFEAVAAVTNNDMQPVPDDVLTISNNHFMPQQDMDIVFAAANATSLTSARIVSPSNRQITLPFIRPIHDGTAQPTPQKVADYRDNPFRIRGLEELAVEGTTTAAGPQDFNAHAGFQVGFQPVPRGNIFTMRGTATTASVAQTWTNLAMTWADTLPEGNYACVGMHGISATGLANRLIFENQYWRPGSLASVLATNDVHPMFSRGGLGVWGMFKPTRMPIVQHLNSAAGVVVHTIFLDLIRVS